MKIRILTFIVLALISSTLNGNFFYAKNSIQKVNPSLAIDSTGKWKFGINLTQHFNYPIMHTAITFNISKYNHHLYIGPEYTKLLEESIEGDAADKWEKNYGGLNFGYKYFINSSWKNTNIFLQLNFSIYEASYTQIQRGPPWSTGHKRIIIENTAGVGINYMFNNRVGIFGGIGFGSTNGFFLMLDEFIPHSFLGFSYRFK